jgi:RNA polymerase sigma factor (sigma-70 family)
VSEFDAALRVLAPQVLAILVRRHGRFDACEDATQEALIAASAQWTRDGIPESPRGWLVTVAERRLVDEWRSDGARRRREVEWSAQEIATGDPETVTADDTLDLLFLCAHPALSAPSQVALTLRAVGGLTTAQIAAAFLVPEATMAQRISRAKQSIRTAGSRFDAPAAERAERLDTVMRVLYLIFNEGYAASSGDHTQRVELTAEGISLARMLRDAAPDETEVAGLLALMLLTDARRGARVTHGELIPLAEQNRALWDREEIEEGISLLSSTLGTGPLGQYQLQAAIAAVHDEAGADADTDWPQILALYDVLARITPGPVVALNRAVAVAMVHGPRAGLAELGAIDDDRMAENHRIHSVRAHLLERAGEREAAIDAYRSAARLSRSTPEQRYLALRAARLVEA